MKYLKVFTDFLDVIDALSDGAVGRLFRAMLRYALDGTEPALKGREAVLWTVARQSIDREAQAYGNKVKHLKRGHSSVSKETGPVSEQDKDNDKDKNKDKDKDKDFFSSETARLPAEKKEIPPTLEEVMAFSQEAGLNVDAHLFFDYYEANGWFIGKLPMKDWRAALRAWVRNAPAKPAQAKAPSSGDNFKKAMEMLRMEEAKGI